MRGGQLHVPAQRRAHVQREGDPAAGQPFVVPQGLPVEQAVNRADRVLITGGSSGIGAATARAFAARGFLVAVTGRDKQALERVASETGGVFIQGDLCEPGCPRRVVDEAAAALGGLDVVVSNAGIGWAGPFTAMTDEEIDTLLDVNLRATAHVARAALDYLRPGVGRLVFVGSIAGLVGVTEEAWYSATKSGVGMLAEVLRTELRADRIGVTLVIPGVVDTPYFERRNVPYQRRHPRPLGVRIIATAIVDAVEQRTEMIVVPGWLAWPARLRGGFPTLYRKLEQSLESGGGGRWRGRKRAPVVGSAGPWPRNADA
ncbi:MAG TPA: SDR family NAD(P)-dependent oxidoreductase [Trebonia sp.]